MWYQQLNQSIFLLRTASSNVAAPAFFPVLAAAALVALPVK